MKQGIIIAVLVVLLTIGCGQQKQLKVTYLSDPPGGTLYKQNNEAWGPCPKVLTYDLSEKALAQGQLEARGLIVRWPSGPEERSDDPIILPIDGTDQQFTFVQPGQTPNDRHASDPPNNERTATAPVESEDDAGLREEPDEPDVTDKETTKTTELIDKVVDERDETEQAPAEQVSGLREEPDEPGTRTADTTKTAGPDGGVVEKQAGAGQIPTPGHNLGIREEPDGLQAQRGAADSTGSVQESQATIARPRSQSALKLPEDPNEESVQAKVETKTVDFGNGVLVEFAPISAGEFLMASGSDGNSGDADKTATQRIRISKPFQMSVYEVTQEQYEKVMGTNPSHFKGPKHPVETVSWNDAEKFCAKLSSTGNGLCRLPTEAEWEYACRAGTATAYYWGDDFDDRFALTIADRGSGTENVGTRLPNAWGLYDMSGNVWEWCSDWYGEHDPSLAEVTDPQGPSSGNFKVLRGGSWGHSQRSCRSSHRNWHTPNHRYDDCGFRIVLEAKKTSD